MDIVCNRNRAGVHLLDCRITEEIPDLVFARWKYLFVGMKRGEEMQFHFVLCVKL
jgi:hypothetical protein